MNQTKTIITVTNLADIVKFAERYDFGLDDEQRMPCIGDHNGTEPTMRVDQKTQSFYCTDPSCRIHGNVIDLVRHVENIDVREAVSLVAEEIGLAGVSITNGCCFSH